MESSGSKNFSFCRIARFFRRIFFSLFKGKDELIEKVEIHEETIASQAKELFELKRENNDLESRLESYKKNSDKVEFIEELGSVDNIIKKVEEYDKNEILIRDLEMENRKLEQENKKLKSLR